FRYQQELEQKRRLVVGVNEFTVDDEPPIDILRIDPALESQQAARVRDVRAKRDQAKCTNALTSLRRATAGTDNLKPYILAAVGRLRAVVEVLKRRKATSMVVCGAAMIPDDYIAALRERGVEEIFTPGSPLQEIGDWLRKRFPSDE